MSTTAISQGDVVLTLDGEPVVLRCTLGAAKGVNGGFGSFVAAFKRVQEFDMAAFVAIVALGLGKTSKDVEAAVWCTGMPPLSKPLAEYLSLLSNGGRKDDATEATEAGGTTKGEG